MIARIWSRAAQVNVNCRFLTFLTDTARRRTVELDPLVCVCAIRGEKAAESTWSILQGNILNLVCACLYVCMCICVYVCMCVCLYVCVRGVLCTFSRVPALHDSNGGAGIRPVFVDNARRQ